MTSGVINVVSEGDPALAIALARELAWLSATSGHRVVLLVPGDSPVSAFFPGFPSMEDDGDAGTFRVRFPLALGTVGIQRPSAEPTPNADVILAVDTAAIETAGHTVVCRAAGPPVSRPTAGIVVPVSIGTPVRLVGEQVITVPLTSGLAAVESLARPEASGPLWAVQEIARRCGLGDLPAPTIPEALRSRYARTLGLPASVVVDRIRIWYLAVDRPWAEWTRSLLVGRAAMEITMARIGTHMIDESATNIVLCSRHVIKRPESLAALRTTARNTPSGRVIMVDVDRLFDHERRGDLKQSYPGVRISLVTEPDGTPSAVRDETNVRADELAVLLLGGLGLAAHDQLPTPPGGSHPRRWVYGLPPRHRELVYRDEDLDALRARLLAYGGVARISGAPGVGKTELVKEYAHRFGHTYELIGWINASNREAALVDMTRLAGGLNIQVAELPTVLTGYDSYLLIFDNVDEPDTIAQWCHGGGNGHIIWTTQRLDTTGLRVEDFSGGRSLDRLGVTDLLDEDERLELGRLLGGLPVDVEMAAKWITQASSRDHEGDPGAARAEYARRLLTALRERAGRDEPYLPSARRAVLERIRQTLTATGLGQLSWCLAELCVFLAPDCVDLRIVHHDAMIRQLATAAGEAGADLVDDPVEVDRALRLGARYGLFDVEWGRPSMLRMHKVVQDGIRVLLGSTATRRRDQTLTALAGYAPTEFEIDDGEPATRQRFNELYRHLRPSGALLSGLRPVRRWLVNHTRYLHINSEVEIKRLGIEQVTALHARWTREFGAEDRLTMRLARELANLHRELGAPRQAQDIDEPLLERQQRILGPCHLRTLITERGVGGNLLDLDLTDLAYQHNRRAYQAFLEQLGEDHRESRMLANNLARTLAETGRLAEALELQRDNFDRRRRVYGDGDARTWLALGMVGHYQRQLGLFRDSLETLSEARRQLRAHCGPNPGTEHRLWFERAIRLTSRKRLRPLPGFSEESIRLSSEHIRLLGADHEATMACRVIESVDLHLDGRTERAIELAEHCRARLSAPSQVARCGVNLIWFLVEHASHAPDGPTRAARLAEAETVATAVRSLVMSLRPGHPWRVAAAVNIAGLRHHLGDTDSARELLLAEQLDAAQRRQGREVPALATARADLRLITGLRSGGTGEWRFAEVEID